MNEEISTSEKVAVVALGLLGISGVGYLFYALKNRPKEKTHTSKLVPAEKAVVSINDKNNQPWTLDGRQGETNEEGEFVYRWTYRFSGDPNPIYPDSARAPVRLSQRLMTVEEAKKVARKEISSLIDEYVSEAKATPFPFL